MNEKNAKNPEGFRLGTWNWVMIGLALVVGVMLLGAISRTVSQYTMLQEDTREYISALESSTQMQQASDYLTRQARHFTVKDSLKSVDLYFEEAQVTRRRENAVEAFRSGTDDEAALRYLEAALDGSKGLMDAEYRAMRLMFSVYGYEDRLADYPQIAQVILTQREQALSAEEKRELAQEMVFGEEYCAAKERIDGNLRSSTLSLVEKERQRQEDSSDRMTVQLHREQAQVALLLLIMLAVVVLTGVLLIYPLQKAVRHITARDRVPVTGSYEMRYLANSYNAMYESSKERQDQLSYEATHDPLTGVLNRKAYEEELKAVGKRGVALIIIDVDGFKQINDKYGHAMGDRVLRFVAESLESSFRSDDKVCRIGGDEFAVLMMHATSALRGLLADKVRLVREKLAQKSEDMPAVTISVGAAFSDREVPKGSLFEDADATLYSVKQSGKNGFAIY